MENIEKHFRHPLLVMAKFFVFGSPLVWLMWTLINSSVQDPQINPLRRAVEFIVIGVVFWFASLAAKNKIINVKYGFIVALLSGVSLVWFFLNTACVFLISPDINNQYFQIAVIALSIFMVIHAVRSSKNLKLMGVQRKPEDFIIEYPSHFEMKGQEAFVESSAPSKVSNKLLTWIVPGVVALAYPIQQYITGTYGREWAMMLVMLCFLFIPIGAIHGLTFNFLTFCIRAHKLEKQTGKPVVFEGTWEAYKASRGL